MMNCILYDDQGEAQWSGTHDQVYSVVKHHVSDGMYMVVVPGEGMELLYREEGIVFPLGHRPVSDTAPNVQDMAAEGRARLDEMLAVAEERVRKWNSTT